MYKCVFSPSARFRSLSHFLYLLLLPTLLSLFAFFTQAAQEENSSEDMRDALSGDLEALLAQVYFVLCWEPLGEVLLHFSPLQDLLPFFFVLIFAVSTTLRLFLFSQHHRLTPWVCLGPSWLKRERLSRPSSSNNAKGPCRPRRSSWPGWGPCTSPSWKRTRTCWRASG